MIRNLQAMSVNAIKYKKPIGCDAQLAGQLYKQDDLYTE